MNLRTLTFTLSFTKSTYYRLIFKKVMTIYDVYDRSLNEKLLCAERALELLVNEGNLKCTKSIVLTK